LPRNCRIEYYDQTVAEEKAKLNIPDFVIDLEKEYEFIEGIGDSGEVQLRRKTNCNEEVAAKSYIFVIKRNVKSKDDIQHLFLREVEALISLKHPCIISLQGCCLPRDNQGSKIVTEY
jgi:serine/threonine protein kinase